MAWDTVEVIWNIICGLPTNQLDLRNKMCKHSVTPCVMYWIRDFLVLEKVNTEIFTVSF